MDKACTDASAQVVEQHLSECEKCSKLLSDMKNSETNLNNEIIKERDEVLVKQAKYFKRRSTLVGGIIGAIFAVPILVCLIVNLATGAGLTWFFIVLAAMLVPASLTIVPIMVPEKKAMWTVGSFFASLLVLLAVVCIYTGGGWFFYPIASLMILASFTLVPIIVPRNKGLWTLCSFMVSLFILFAVCCIYTKGSWFLIAASAVLFGLTIIFMPIVVNSKPVAKLLKNNKALAVMTAYTLTYVLMMICIGVSINSDEFAKYAFAISVPPIAYMWSMFAVIRYVKLNSTLKTAICIFITALFGFIGDTIVFMFLGDGFHFPKFDLGSGSVFYISNDSVDWIILIFGTIAAAVLAAVGIYKQKKINNFSGGQKNDDNE